MDHTINAKQESRYQNYPNLSFNDYLPTFQFSEYHDIEIDQGVDQVFSAVKDLDLSQSKVINLLFLIRGLPKDMHTLSSFLDYGFILLEERKNEEIIFGFLIGWKGLNKVMPAEFRGIAANDYIKGVWNFRLSPRGGRTRLSTETRVFCPNKGSKFRFSIYWLFISRFSGLIRKIMLRMIKQQAELVAN